jgi:hypothetical protein
VPAEAPTVYRKPDLGDPLSHHRFTLGSKLRVIAFAFVGAPILLTLLAVFGVIAWGKDWDVMTYFGASILYILMPGLGIKIWLEARSRDRDVVRIYDRGLSLVDHGKERFIAWADVTSLTSEVKQTVTNGIPGPVTHRYVLEAPGGAVTLTHGFEDVEDLADWLRRKTAEVLEPRIQEDLLAKKRVHFGPFDLSLAGVGYGGNVLHWRDAEARFEAGQFIIERANGKAFCSVKIAAVPNAHIALGLLERMRLRALESG